jgi:hypothetical protein
MERKMLRRGLCFTLFLLIFLFNYSPGITENINENSESIEFVAKAEKIGVIENPGVQWVKTFGSITYDDFAEKARQTSDGGFIIVGETRSYGSDHYEDAWLIKTDSQGNEQWNRTYGEPGPLNIDDGRSVQQTADGCYIFSGNTFSYGDTDGDFWLVKTDFLGNEQWNRTYGGPDTEHGNCVRQTADGGYILIGWTCSQKGHALLIKTDSDGYEQWNKTFYPGENAVGYSGQQTSDGGYVLAGRLNYVYEDYTEGFLVKTDNDGNKQWNRTFGKPVKHSYFLSVQQTPDDGYILSGIGSSSPEEKHDMAWLVKTDKYGNEEWNSTFWEPSYGYIGEEVDQTIDGGYVITGTRQYTDEYDSFLIKTDRNGTKQWEVIIYATCLYDKLLRSVEQTNDGGFILAGENSRDGLGDVLLVKIGHVPEVNITKPENAIYLFNNKIRDFFMPLIIGSVDVEVQASDSKYDVDRVEFYVDDELVSTDTVAPYSWKWIRPSFFRHELKVTAINRNNNGTSDELILWKFL